VDQIGLILIFLILMYALFKMVFEVASLNDKLRKHKWRGIDSAPKDGVKILGLTHYGVEVVRWCDWNGKEYSPGDGWIGLEQDSTCLPPNYRREKAQHQPTHWMPLPDKPKKLN